MYYEKTSLAAVLKITLNTVGSVPIYAPTRVAGSDLPFHSSLTAVFLTLFFTILFTCDLLPPEGRWDEYLNRQHECLNQKQMRYITSSGSIEHYASKEVIAVNNTQASHLKYLHKL